MAKVFYLGGGTPARGMLRAVVALDQLNSLIPTESVSYMGTDFPEGEFGDAITVVQISQNEVVEPWANGFSRIHVTPAEFDERLKFLPESKELPTKTSQEKRRNGSDLIHWLTRGTHS